ncbi:MAG: twin-arginine translocase subunit TatC [Deltaproteobacteria bacterium]|nr:twin-arginine translocase subunit TatC [Deltaproteobacteria bacterium]
MNDEEARLPLSEHLEELRLRLIRSLIALGIGTGLCYNWAEGIYRALLRPLLANLPGNSRLIFTELTEAFLTYFKVALWGGFILASPVIFYQLWRFISPGLYRKERKLVIVFAGWSTAGLLAGMAFGYFVAIPQVFSFFLSFARTIVVPMPSMKESLSLVLRMLFIFGVMFELPLLLYLLGRAGILTPSLLRRGRKVAILGVLILGAVLTPPDVVSQILIAAPLYVLYEGGILLCAVGARAHNKASVRA